MNTEILKDGIWNAVSNRRHEDVVNFIKNGVDVNFQRNGFTLLSHAILNSGVKKEEMSNYAEFLCNSLLIIKELVSSGANLRAKNDFDGKMPIFILKSKQVFEILFQKEIDGKDEELFLEICRNGRHDLFSFFDLKKEWIINGIRVIDDFMDKESHNYYGFDGINLIDSKEKLKGMLKEK